MEYSPGEFDVNVANPPGRELLGPLDARFLVNLAHHYIPPRILPLSLVKQS